MRVRVRAAGLFAAIILGVALASGACIGDPVVVPLDGNPEPSNPPPTYIPGV